MLYWLSTLNDTLPGVNVFRYTSFRAAWGLITALAFAYLFFPVFIRWMNRRKVDQIIRKDGPESHLLNKVGTPTMGGVCMLVGVVLASLLWARLDNPYTWMTLAVLVGYGIIGFVDDWKKVMQRSADGLAGRWKLVGQVSIAGATIGLGWWMGWISPDLTLPFVKNVTLNFGELWEGAPDLGILYVLGCTFILVAMSNGVNLTDGLDGLAIGPVMTCAATYALLAYLAGHANFAEYLGIANVGLAGELAVVCVAIIGGGLGFLWYNAYPAQIFMGDVGSLSLGGTLGMIAVCTKHEILLAVVGGVFVLETVSVILQVGSYKLRGKRIFHMAPIHHHYEKVGWSEPKIIVRFWILSIVLAMIALSTLKLR